MATYYCPSCQKMIMTPIGVVQEPKFYSCECGMTWRTITSDIHYTVKTDKREEIRKVLENTLQAYHTKRNEEVNRMRDEQKKKTIEYLITELFKGPIEGGTLSSPSSICNMFGSDIWTAL